MSRGAVSVQGWVTLGLHLKRARLYSREFFADRVRTSVMPSHGPLLEAYGVRSARNLPSLAQLAISVALQLCYIICKDTFGRFKPYLAERTP